MAENDLPPLLDVKTHEQYAVRDQNVFFSALVGNAQFGTISATFADAPDRPLIQPSAQNIVRDLGLGAGSNLAGRSLLVLGVLSDVNPLTDRMVMTYTLTGGVQDGSVLASGTVSQPNDIGVFRARFDFVAAP